MCGRSPPRAERASPRRCCAKRWSRPASPTSTCATSARPRPDASCEGGPLRGDARDLRGSSGRASRRCGVRPTGRGDGCQQVLPAVLRGRPELLPSPGPGRAADVAQPAARPPPHGDPTSRLTRRTSDRHAGAAARSKPSTDGHGQASVTARVISLGRSGRLFAALGRGRGRLGRLALPTTLGA